MKKIFIIYCVAIVIVSIVYMVPSKKDKQDYEKRVAMYEAQLKRDKNLTETQVNEKLENYKKEANKGGESFVTALKSSFFTVTLVLVIFMLPIWFIKQAFLR